MNNIRIRRSIAFLIDMGIISIVVFVFDNLLPVTIQVHDFEISGIQLTLGISLTPVFYGLYFVVFDMISSGQTTGKSILNILVVSKTEEVLSMRTHLLRSLYKLLSLLILPVAILLFVLDNYTIQDHYADTMTICTGR